MHFETPELERETSSTWKAVHARIQIGPVLCVG